MLHYRNATLEDLPLVVEIYNSTVPLRTVTADTVPVTVDSKVQWFYQHTPGKHPLWIVSNEAKEAIGWVSFQPFKTRPAYNITTEIGIYLHEEHREKGYGKQVLEHSIAAAPSLGIRNIIGVIFAHNEPSIKLFKNFGFNEWGYLPNVAELDGIERSVQILGKRLE